MIYFDHNATTRIDERVVAVMQPFLQDWYGNPSALYRLGRTARSAIETARAQVAALVGVNANQVYFTSGGTEANNLALHQVAAGRKIVVSALEHPSVMVPASLKQANGNSFHVLGVDAQGCIDVAVARAIAWQSGDFLSVQLANNETGVLQDVAQLADYVRSQGAIVHTDAVQAAGKIALDLQQTCAQLLSISSHKIYGPKGCGALITEQGVRIHPLICGGGQEDDVRSGTENVPAIVGFGKAAELAKAELDSRRQQLMHLRSYLEQGLQSIHGCVIFSAAVARLPNTVQFGLPEVDGEMLLMQLDRKNIAVSSGSACSSGASKPSEVLTAMGVPAALAKSAIRVSLGYQNTCAEIDTFLHLLKSLSSTSPI